jgi:hypothetical protein
MKINRKVPVYYQNLTITKLEHREDRSRIFVPMKFYQTDKSSPDIYYKPVSKICNVKIEK